MTIPRGVKNHNPGNIVKSGIAWQGKIVGPDERFETFNSAHNGIRALAALLISYDKKHGLNTVRGIISRWAPSVENNTSAYVTAVCAALGVDPDTIIYVQSPDTLRKLTTAIIQHENGQQPYASSLIGAAIGDALGFHSKDLPEALQDIGVQESPVFTNPEQPPKMDKPRKHMDPISIFLPIIAQLIPQIAHAIGGGKNDALAQTVLDTVVKATGSSNEQEAVTKMQADPVMLKAATAAVVAEPSVVAALVEVGGGIGGARNANAAYVASLEDDEPWRIPLKFLFNPLNWVTGAFLWFVQQFVPVLALRVADLSGEAVLGLILLVLAVIAVIGAFYYGTYMQKKEE